MFPSPVASFVFVILGELREDWFGLGEFVVSSPEVDAAGSTSELGGWHVGEAVESLGSRAMLFHHNI